MPEPSSESSAWWDTLDIASIQQAVNDERKKRNGSTTNPFEQLELNENTLPQSAKNNAAPPPVSIKRKPPPPDPSSKPSSPSTQSKPPVNTSTKPKLQAPSAESPSTLRPVNNRNESSNTSLMDQQDEEMRRQGLKVREATNEWQVITPNAMKR